MKNNPIIRTKQKLSFKLMQKDAWAEPREDYKTYQIVWQSTRIPQFVIHKEVIISADLDDKTAEVFFEKTRIEIAQALIELKNELNEVL